MDDTPFTASAEAIRRARGEPVSALRNSIGLHELDYGHVVFRFQDGGRLEWRRTGWWRPGYVFTDRFSNPVVRFALDGTVEGYGTGAEWHRSIESRRDLLLVLALGWLLLLVGGEARLPVAPARPERPRTPAARPAGQVVPHPAREVVDIEAAG